MPTYRTYQDFSVVCLDASERERLHCRYTYCVSEGFTSAHVAFTKADDLLRWLDERGLLLTAPLPDGDTWQLIKIVGTYRLASYLDDWQDFLALEPARKIALLDNARYTLGLVTRDADGARTVHHLNCNVQARTEFDYWTIEQQKEGWQDMVQNAAHIQGSPSPCANCRRMTYNQNYTCDSCRVFARPGFCDKLGCSKPATFYGSYQARGFDDVRVYYCADHKTPECQPLA